MKELNISFTLRGRISSWTVRRLYSIDEATVKEHREALRRFIERA